MPASKASSSWQLTTRKGHLELHAGHPDYDALMDARAALVREWQDAREAGNGELQKEIETLLELKFTGVGI